MLLEIDIGVLSFMAVVALITGIVMWAVLWLPFRELQSMINVFKIPQKDLRRRLKRDKEILKAKGWTPASEKYHKVTVFSETILFVPLFVIHVGMIPLYFIRYQGYLLEYAICYGFCTICFIGIYCYSGNRVKTYNQNMESRIIVKGTVTHKPALYKQEYRKNGQIEITYEYSDPCGTVHNSVQRVDINWYYSPQKVIEKWEKVYSKGSIIDVLILPGNFKDSYIHCMKIIQSCIVCGIRFI